ncbi:hypothetical protein FRB95_010416 [Tulasnella sp. JGI-2019a]|nr:hypothetical protein FRB95_010416 [Tulasnella sp. JGI-2019a]
MPLVRVSTFDLENGYGYQYPHPLSYKLPDLVESVRQGWIFSAQGAAVVSVLLCGAETQLITMVKTPDGNADVQVWDTYPRAYKFLLLLSYSAFILNASATVASLLMIDRLDEIPLRAKTYIDEHPDAEMPPFDYLLEDYNAGGRWTWMRWHCLVTLLAGSWCMTLQIFLYIYLHEATSVWITMALVCAIGVSPWFALLKAN